MEYINPILTVIQTVAGFLKGNNAYLDPGSGSFILQLLLATLLGSLFIIKTYWRKIKDFFGRLFSKNKDSQEE
jgi:hypothetical protein